MAKENERYLERIKKQKKTTLDDWKKILEPKKKKNNDVDDPCEREKENMMSVISMRETRKTTISALRIR